MNTEYVRNLHSNYVRLSLEEKPEEKRYQYCILSRGGIKGLLPCSLRYLDGGAYLYYDITSKQNLVQFHQKGNVSREWLLDFVESLHKLQKELERFLLQEGNVIFEPQHVFQDLENNVFSYMYVPYYNGENQFLKLLAFLIEKIDYDDSELVECVYKMYESMEKNGDTYLQEQIFKDVKVLEKKKDRMPREKQSGADQEGKDAEEKGAFVSLERSLEDQSERKADKPAPRSMLQRMEDEETQEAPAPRRLLGIFENKKNKKGKEQEKREEYRESMERMISGYAVAEETEYEEGYGRTTFITQKPDKREEVHRLYFGDGRKASELENTNLLIGKYKDKVDLFLDDPSVSRMHARVLKDANQYYLEDENSTNGTFVNQDRLQPYEKKKLEVGDEIKIGNVVLFYR